MEHEEIDLKKIQAARGPQQLAIYPKMVLGFHHQLTAALSGLSDTSFRSTSNQLWSFHQDATRRNPHLLCNKSEQFRSDLHIRMCLL